jgi:serine/threonine protein kinase
MEIFEAALKLAPAERRAWLDAHCGDDAVLRDEVEQMLAIDAAPSVAFSTQAIGAGVASLARDLADGPVGAATGEPRPTAIGLYRIRNLIGQGGMGIVYEAEQQSPRRTVALKVIRPEFATRSMRQRFELEAHVLGRLQHPGIAQVFEAGTFETPGGPRMFIAMELIRGKTLIDHANDPANPLSVRQRLALMARVCDAVHHAHQRGVIHRDLKPSNILVVEEGTEGRRDSAFESRGSSVAGSAAPHSLSTPFPARDGPPGAVGQPKILDFGVARATDVDMQLTLARTHAGQLVGTPAYMSPEQIAGDPGGIDTRSDVYALGVVLYQLLAGRMPHDVSGKSLPEVARVIREHSPTQLSSVNRALRGEVETIVAKALEKDKSRRYQSAAELAADLRRYLAGEPIEAKRDSSWYVLQKTLRRYRVAAALGGAILVLTLTAGAALGFLYRQAVHFARAADEARHEAERETERVRLEERKAREVNRVLVRILQSANAQSDKGRDRTVREVLEEHGEHAIEQLENQPEVQAVLHHTIGQSLYSLGDYARALHHHEAAYGLAKRVFAGQEHREPADYAVSLAAVLGMTGQQERAEALLREALATHQRLLGPESAAAAWDMQALGLILSMKGDVDGAETLIRAGFELHRRGVVDEDGPLAGEQSLIVDALSSLCLILHQKGAYAEAEPIAREALEVAKRELGEQHPQVALAMNNLAATLRQLGKAAEALDLYHRAIEIQQATAGEDSPEAASGLSNLGLLYLELRLPDKAATAYREALEIRRKRLPPGHLAIAEALSGLGAALTRQGRAVEAEPLLVEALEIRRRELKPDDGRLGNTLNYMGECLLAQRRYADAEPLLREALQILKTRRGVKHPATLDVTRSLIAACAALGRADEAAELQAALEAATAAAQPE